MNILTFGEAMLVLLGGVAAIITIVKNWNLICNFVANRFQRLWTVIKEALWLLWIPGRIQVLETQRDILEQQQITLKRLHEGFTSLTEQHRKSVDALEGLLTEVKTEVSVIHHILFSDVVTLSKRAPAKSSQDLTYPEAIHGIVTKQGDFQAVTKSRKYPPLGVGDYLTEHVARRFSRTVDAERIIQELENSMAIICNMQP